MKETPKLQLSWASDCHIRHPNYQSTVLWLFLPPVTWPHSWSGWVTWIEWVSCLGYYWSCSTGSAWINTGIMGVVLMELLILYSTWPDSICIEPYILLRGFHKKWLSDLPLFQSDTPTLQCWTCLWECHIIVVNPLCNCMPTNVINHKHYKKDMQLLM